MKHNIIEINMKSNCIFCELLFVSHRIPWVKWEAGGGIAFIISELLSVLI